MPTRKQFKPRKAGGKSGLNQTQRLQVKRLISKESNLGYKDVVVDNTDVGWSEAPQELTQIAEGDSDTERDGQQIQLKSLQWRINTRPGASQTVASTVRFIVYRWMKESAPAANSVLINNGVVDAPISPLNMTTNKGEYQILHDQMFVTASFDGSPHQHRVFKKYMPMRGKVTYSGPLVGNGLKGRLYFQFISDIASNGPRVLSAFRIRYTK